MAIVCERNALRQVHGASPSCHAEQSAPLGQSSAFVSGHTESGPNFAAPLLPQEYTPQGDNVQGSSHTDQSEYCP